jgi:hypothetical protein
MPGRLRTAALSGETSMKPVPQLAFVVVVSALTAAGAVSLLAPHDAATDAESGSSAATLAAVQRSLADVQAAQGELRASLDHLALRVDAAAPRAEALPLQDLDAAIARVLDRREAAARAQGELAAAASVADELDAEEAVAALLGGELDEAAREALWQRVREAGLLDEVLAVYEARAKANPNDPAMQLQWGEACLQKIFEVGSGPLAGVWADKADNAFDAALALDDHHWEARFTKAVSLSFWPPIFGKQPEAIAQFQTLLSQQAGQPKSPQFAQTYVMLGNLYAQQGKADQAQATWTAGLAEYPGDAELLSKLATP